MKKNFANVNLEVVKLQSINIIATSGCDLDAACSTNVWDCPNDDTDAEAPDFH